MNVETPYEQLFFTTAFIQADYPDGSAASGTGFFYGVNVDADQLAMFLVTNKHVVDGAVNVRVTLIAGAHSEMKQPILGKAETITIPAIIFSGHPDPDIDVTVAPISPWMNALQSQGKQVFLRSLAPAIALTDSVAATLDALEDVTFIGYPSGLYDKLNHLPIARRGIRLRRSRSITRGSPSSLSTHQCSLDQAVARFSSLRQGAMRREEGDSLSAAE